MAHPDPKLKRLAEAQANKGSEEPHLWWAEYRDAYANAAGLGDEPPIEPTRGLQAYLSSLDEKVLKLRRKWRAAQ